MKIFNKFVESKKEPSNKNDIWFDGSVFKIYKEGEWRTITLTKEAIDRIIEYAKSLDIYVMVKELPEFGEKGKIYVLQTIVGDSIELSEYVWENDSWKLVGNFNSVSLVLDNELSETSHNAVANYVITEALNTKVNKSELATPDWNAQKGEDGYIKNKTHFFEWYAKPEDKNFNDLLLGLKDKTPISVTDEGYIRTVKYLANECASMWEQDFEYFDPNWKANSDDILDGFVTVPDIFGGNGSPKISISRDYDDGDNELIHVTVQWYTDYTSDDVNKIIDQICSNYYIIPYHNYYILELNDKYISSNIARTAYVASKQQLTELSEEKEDKTNKVTSLTEESTDEQYPSAKAVYALSERIRENEILIGDLLDMKIDKEADDYYPQLSVGLADNLSGVDVVDSEVNFRRSGGGAISDGVARIEAIKGNSVVWNQLSKNAASYPNDWHFEGAYEEQGRVTYDSDKHLLALAGKDNATSLVVKLVLNIPTNHKVLVSYGVELKTNVERNGAPILGYFGSPTQWLTNGIDISSVTNKEYRVEKIMSLTSDVKHIFIGLYSGSVSPSYVAEDKMNIYSPLIIDLTKMFGAGYEPSTIEDFYARIPMGVDENAYNEGEVIHMDVQSIESQGVNAWDEEWELGSLSSSNGNNATSTTSIRSKNYLSVVGGKEYYINALYNSFIFCYDKDKNFLGLAKDKGGATVMYNEAFSLLNDTAFIRFYSNSATYNHDICINISDASINGKYFPYIKRVENLAVIRKYFPQGMKSAGSAHDEIRYNKVTQKWEMVQRIGSVDLGGLVWHYNSASGQERFYTLGISDSAPIQNDSTPANLLCAKYDTKSFNHIFAHVADKAIGRHSTGQFVIYDSSYTDAATFKTEMQGVILYYELAEPIVTELDAEDQFKDLDYQVWNCGTEKSIAEGKSAPLAADITYGFNAIGKIKELESLVAALRAKVGI